MCFFRLIEEAVKRRPAHSCFVAHALTKLCGFGGFCSHVVQQVVDIERLRSTAHRAIFCALFFFWFVDLQPTESFARLRKIDVVCCVTERIESASARAA